MNCKEEALKLLDELIATGEQVLVTRRSPGTPVIGDFVLEPQITYAWATHAKNLLVNVFGLESVYYSQFSYLLGRELTYAPMLRAQAILKSARNSFLPEPSGQYN